jgi:hypothetical protein
MVRTDTPVAASICCHSLGLNSLSRLTTKSCIDSRMVPQDRPYLGSPQPKAGSAPSPTMRRMGRRSKKDRPPALVQSVLKDVLKRLRDRKYAKERTETARNKKLAADSDTTLSQIQRILDLKLAPGIDIVERLAGALEVRPMDLLTPYFGLAQERDEPLMPGTAANNDKSPSQPRAS